MLEQGQVFAGHRVIGQLGAGGMGEVYLVEHPGLGRKQALKVIAGAAHSPGLRERFINEARTVASLDHPNIIAIHAFGVEDGLPWFTMPYLDGADLSHARLSAGETTTVITAVAHALDHAHRRGVIHRDIKPANIVVTRDAGTGAIDRVVTLDFGIARAAESPHVTATNLFLGTLVHAAPEVIDGEPASAASDEYALACTAYEILSGRAPFGGEGPAALLASKLTKPVPPLAPTQPAYAAADPVLARALAADPAQRFGTCSAFAEALASALATPPAPPTIIGPVWGPSGPATPSGPAMLPAPATMVASPPAFGSYPPPGPPPGPVPFGHPGPGYPGAGHPGAPPAWPAAPPRQRRRRRSLLIGSSVVLTLLLVVGVAVTTVLLTRPSPAPPRVGATALSSSGETTCAVVDHHAYCWGDNSSGQVGNGDPAPSDGTSEYVLAPTRVEGVDKVDKVVTGSDHSCAVAAGTAYCWGDNSNGQLGTGQASSTTVARPAQVKGLPGTVTDIAIGFYSTCAVADGKAYCWGYNSGGQLGNGVEESASDVVTPTLVQGLPSSVSAISSAYRTVCAIAGGAVYCWGYNSDGQVGNGSTADSTTAVAVPGIAGTVTRISAGYYHSCAVADEKAYCWGNNTFHQISSTESSPVNAPTAVTGPTGPVTDISAGYFATCLVAGARAYCAGDNDDGQIGTGSTDDGNQPTVPQLVTGMDSKVTAITTARSTACTISDLVIYCWGANEVGQVGNNQFGTSPVTRPTAVVNLPS
ncbi:putative RCC1 repeat-containing protein kinase [Gordonia polyisoprenivorans VH2]|uniref:Putative RCC1 repeat-containing protein kinase n=2 Tax=Gordonia TaxID=2053 RepID=H6MZL1_GORPV|nr:protein kinase [Gordonia polyisoprenivorans]AFA71998.1 putative RCC1 repeat-containing protein kinase [Gordonia polyisoprenivorans VH2]